MNTENTQGEQLPLLPSTDGDPAVMMAPVVDGIPLTDWQTPDVKPMAIGVYKTKYEILDIHGDAKTEIGYSKWDGTNWGPQFDTPEAAAGFVDTATFPPPTHYRGLAIEHPDHQL